MPEPSPHHGTPALRVRRVVTTRAADGRTRIASDGTPPLTVSSRTGHALSELLYLPAPPQSLNDGGEPPEKLRGAFPEAGASGCRLVRFPALPAGTPTEQTWLRMPGEDPTQPGMHRSDTLDLMVVLDGTITLGLDDGEYPLHPGDVVVQRATRHRWRVTGERACTLLGVLLSASPDTAADPGLVPRAADRTGVDGPRRLITTTAADGRSRLAAFGPAVVRLPARGPHGVTIDDLWHTGGPLTHCAQGGDPDGPWALEPAAGGVVLRQVAFDAGHDPGVAGVHTTNTVDVDVLLSGALELALPTPTTGAATTATVLRPGDVVVQHGTAHRWRPVGTDPAVMMSVMFALRSPA